jgi:hypothetical protein
MVVIIITGPGRSGTSFLAKLYVELGLDIGGQWYPEISAGYERDVIVSINKAIMRDLGLRNLDLSHESVVQVLMNLLPVRRLARSQRLKSLIYTLPGMTNGRPGHLRWERMDQVVEKYRPALIDLSRSYPVAKDPRFCFTLPVWIAAGIDIDHVLMAVRSFNGIVNSMTSIRHPFHSEGVVKNILAYGIGLCLSTIYEHRLSHNLIRFPDFLDHPEKLFCALRFPMEVTKEEFLQVFESIVRREFVHDRS